MWVEYVVGPRLAPRVFLRVSSLRKNENFQILIRSSYQVDMLLLNPLFLIIITAIIIIIVIIIIASDALCSNLLACFLLVGLLPLLEAR